MVDRDHFRNVGGAAIEAREIRPRTLIAQVLNAGATTPIDAPAKVNWLYFPVMCRRSMYLMMARESAVDAGLDEQHRVASIAAMELAVADGIGRLLQAI